MVVDFLSNALKEDIGTAKSFLAHESIWDLIEKQELSEVYSRFGLTFHNEDMCLITYYLLNSGIDPLKYMDEIPQNCYSALNIENITIPNNIKSIGKYCFFRCDNLKEIFIPDSVIKIGSSAFCYCLNLDTIRLPEKFKTDEQLNKIFSVGPYYKWYDSIDKLKNNINII